MAFTGPVYAPGALEAKQPRGGLLQGLEEGLERITKENQLRKQMEMQDEFEAKDDARRQERGLAEMAARSQFRQQEIQMEEQLRRERMAELDRKLNTPISEPGSTQGKSWFDTIRIPGQGETKSLNNWMRTEESEDVSPRSLVERIAEAGDRVTFFRNNPEIATKAMQDPDVRNVLKSIPATKASGLGVNTLGIYKEISNNPDAWDDEDVDALEGPSDAAKASLKLFIGRAKIVAEAKRAKEAAEISAKDEARLRKDALDDIQGQAKDARKAAKSARDDYWRMAGKRPKKEEDESDADFLDRIREWSNGLGALNADAKAQETMAAQFEAQARAIALGGEIPGADEEPTIEAPDDLTPEQAAELLKQMGP